MYNDVFIKIFVALFGCKPEVPDNFRAARLLYARLRSMTTRIGDGEFDAMVSRLRIEIRLAWATVAEMYEEVASGGALEGDMVIQRVHPKPEQCFLKYDHTVPYREQELTIWSAELRALIEAMNAALDPDTTVAEIDGWDAQILDALEADPNRSIGWEEHVAATERMRLWVRARHAFLNSWVACQRGGTDDGDGDGAPVCNDPDDNDAAVHPGATEACNGVDDDADGWIDDLSVDGESACDDCVRHDLDDRHFAFCRWPRTNADAEANCQTRGGTLTGPQTTGEYYAYFFYTWPVREAWWTATGTTRCTTWDESAFSAGTAACAESHPSVCALP